MGRFLNADALASTGQGVLGYNMFSYCNNSPCSCIDSYGRVPCYNNSNNQMHLYLSGSNIPITTIVSITPGRETPNLSKEYTGAIYDNYVLFPRRLLHEQLLAYSFSTFDASMNSFSVLSADLYLLKGGWDVGNWNIAPLNIGMIEADLGASLSADGFNGGL